MRQARAGRTNAQNREITRRAVAYCDLGVAIARHTGFYGTIAFCAYQAQVAISALAGQQTAADIVIGAFGDIGQRETTSLSVIVAIATTGWALVERRLRRQKVESMQGRIRALEMMIDPKRTTSGLTPDGRTNPRDE